LDGGAGAVLPQAPRQNVAAGAGFVADVHLHIFAALSAQFGENLFHGMKIIADLSVGPHFALSASFGNGDGDQLTRSLHSSHLPGCLWQSPSFSCGESMVLMDIQSDGEYLFHWCV
jgi:hypothetical protein